MYCLKVEASVYPNGELCQWTKPYPGATADISIFRKNIKFHKLSTKKSAAVLAIVDHGEGHAAHPQRHAILLDKGYIGVKSLIR